MPDHYMNPFDFVPLPPNGPVAAPEDILTGRRLEGYIRYNVDIKTPLHITGKTTKDRNHFQKKYFFQRTGQRVIPGSSIKGMISSFLEALTGSDLRSFTRGNEKDSFGRPAYGKCFELANQNKNRHVGFLMVSNNHKSLDPVRNESISYNYRGRHHNRTRYERNETLPPGFGQNIVKDAAKFFFGHIDQEDTEKERAMKGRVFFEDIPVPDSVKRSWKEAWDLDADSVMGSPNPRANTAWYFTPGRIRNRRAGGRFNVWEVLADKVRGRKFYFHQDPDACHNEYLGWKEGWMDKMVEYDVEVIEDITLEKGVIYFTDMPDSMLNLLVYGLVLNSDMAHKLGALKPFGFGSVKVKLDAVCYRDMSCPFQQIESRDFQGNIDKRLLFFPAFRALKKIMHFPVSDEQENYRFVYPPFRTDRGISNHERGFACVESVENENHELKQLTKQKSKKSTLFFDEYQKSAINYNRVME